MIRQQSTGDTSVNPNVDSDSTPMHGMARRATSSKERVFFLRREGETTAVLVMYLVFCNINRKGYRLYVGTGISWRETGRGRLPRQTPTRCLSEEQQGVPAPLTNHSSPGDATEAAETAHQVQSRQP